MKRLLFFLASVVVFTSLSMYAFAGTIPASTEEITLPANPTLELDARGAVEIVGDNSTTLRVMNKNSSLESASKDWKDLYSLDKTTLGARLKVYSDDRLPKGIKVLVPTNTQIIIESKKGTVSLENLKGSLSGTIKKASLSILKHQGAIDIKMKSGLLQINEFSGDGKDISVDAKEGKIVISVAAIAPGAAIIKMAKGDVKLSIARKTKIAIDASVLEKGLVSRAGRGVDGLCLR